MTALQGKLYRKEIVLSLQKMLSLQTKSHVLESMVRYGCFFSYLLHREG